MREVILPQAVRAVVPPMTSVLIALLKNTSVAAAFGMVEAVATMRILTNNNADQRIGIFLAFAIGYIVIVEIVSFASIAVERKVEGGPMSASVLFDAPGPEDRRPAPRLLDRQHRGPGRLRRPSRCGRCTTAGSSTTRCGSRSSPRSTSRFILVDGLLQTLQMAFFSIVFAVVIGLLLGIGKLSDHRWVRWPAWLVVEFFRAVPVLLLMIFLFYLLAIGNGPLGPFWCVVIALTLYNGSVLAEVFRAGINAVPRGQAEAAYAIGMRKSQVMTSSCCRRP